LPDPDSPTSAIVLFCGMSKEMPFTAANVLSRSRRKEMRRLRMLTNGCIEFSMPISAPRGL
jgi:hypothetical protein